jgi:hypothetical protein
VKWWIPLAAIGALVVIGIGVLLVLFITREDPGARSVADAVEDFRSSEEEGSEEGTSAAGPAPGVYQLDGEGREAISFPPVDQADGAPMPMTVTAGSGQCWTLRIDYNEAHWEDWSLCRDGNSIVETGGRTFQRWDFGVTTINTLSTFTCDPPSLYLDFDAQPGDTVDRSCIGSNDAVEGSTTVAGAVTLVGIETITVEGEDIDAIHLRHDLKVSGSQTGMTETDMWFRASDGLPLRGERRSSIDSDSPVGTIAYTEEGNWQLLSTTPQR